MLWYSGYKNAFKMTAHSNLVDTANTSTGPEGLDWSAILFGNRSAPINWNDALLGNISLNISNLDYYHELVLDSQQYYDAGTRAWLLLSQPDRVIALVLGIIAVLANVVSLTALSQVSQTHRISSYTRLIMSLSVADIMIGLSVILYTINKILNPSYYPGIGPIEARLRSRCTFLCIKALNTSALTATLLHLMAMALDHYVAIHKPLHYPIIMSNRRKVVMMAVFWLLSLFIGFTDFLSALSPDYQKWKPLYNVCEYVWLSQYQEEFPLFVIAFICLITMAGFYISIYREVRRLQQNSTNRNESALMFSSQHNERRSRFNRHQPLIRCTSQQSRLNKHKKTLLTTLLILGSFMLCWLPNCLFQLILVAKVDVDPEAVQAMAGTLFQVDQYLFNLLLLNSIIDPIIYSTRLKEVRVGFKLMCRRLCCGCGWHRSRQTSTSSSAIITSSVRSHRYIMSDSSKIPAHGTLSNAAYNNIKVRQCESWL